MAKARMPKKVAAKKVEAALEALSSVRKNWLRRPNVSAVDVGYKIRDSGITDDLAVRVHVKRKLPPESLAKHEMLAESGIVDKVGEFPIDVIEADYAPTDSLGSSVMEATDVDRRGRVDPLVGGCSVGSERISAGTLGAVVWDRGDGEVCMLSNWHVLCGDPSCSPGEAILQPGSFDGGRQRDKVAELKRFRLAPDADAALARLTGARPFSRDILELDPITGMEPPELGMQVRKSGRTTGLTEGIIDGLGLSTSIDYGLVTQNFTDQIHIVPRPPWPQVDFEISRGGDSGSVWINEATGKAVGLHFAGESNTSPSAEHALANRMVVVAEQLNFSFKPVFVQASPNEDQMRDTIRQIICSRFPFLCGPGGLLGPGAAPQAAAAQESVCHCGGKAAAQAAPANIYGAAGGYGAGGYGIEALVEEIVRELRSRG